MVNMWLYETAFPGTMSFKSKYHHTDRDVPTHVFIIIYCNFAMWFIKVSSNALPVHVVFLFFCEEMSTEGAVYKGHVICNDMYVVSAPGMAVSSILGMMWSLSSSKRWFVEIHRTRTISINSRLINGRIWKDLMDHSRGMYWILLWCCV